MTKGKAASLSGSLLARKGEATAVGLAHSPRDSPRLSSIGPTSDPSTCYPEPPAAEDDEEEGVAGAFSAGREPRLHDDDWTGVSVPSGRRWLHLWLLVPLAGSLIAAAGYISLTWYTDDPRPGTEVASASARVQEAFVPEAILPNADADTEPAGPIVSASNDLRVDGESIEPATLQPPADDPLVAREEPPETSAAKIDASALAEKIPPLIATLPPLRTAEFSPAPSLSASAVGATAVVRQGYLVQLYALRSGAAVHREWRRLQTLHADLFEGLRLTVERIDLESPKRPLYRMLAGRIETAAAARKLCLQARQRRLDCIVVWP